jgi:hypothetical protein
MTPNTTSAPAAAPSTASDTARQLASLARRTSRARRPERSAPKGLPLSQVELAFLTSPVAVDTVPGMPTPTVPTPPAMRSSSDTSPTTASTVAS